MSHTYTSKPSKAVGQRNRRKPTDTPNSNESRSICSTNSEPQNIRKLPPIESKRNDIEKTNSHLQKLRDPQLKQFSPPAFPTRDNRIGANFLGSEAKRHPNAETHKTPRQNEDSHREGRHACGYTVFAPDQKKRLSLHQEAERGLREYEKHKQAQTQSSFHIVETLGGGAVDRDKARTIQANNVKYNKINRLNKQEELRKARRESEEREIATMRAEARRKSDVNKTRQNRLPEPGQIQRNREAFLRKFEEETKTQIEKQNKNKETLMENTRSEKNGGGAVDRDKERARHVSDIKRNKINTLKKQEEFRKSKRESDNRNIATMRAEFRRKSERNEQRQKILSQPAEIRRKREAFLRKVEQETKSEINKEEKQTEKTETSFNPTRSEDPSQALTLDPDFSLLTCDSSEDRRSHPGSKIEESRLLASMFPEVDPDYLNDLLHETGSVDSVLSLLGAD